MQDSRRPTGACQAACFLLKCPLTRNANSVFRRKGGESPNGKGGVQSRTTGAEGHPVCTSEALRARKIGEEAAKVARPILDGTGDSPPFLCTMRARGGGSRPQDRSEAQPGSTRSPGWRRAQSGINAEVDERTPVFCKVRRVRGHHLAILLILSPKTTTSYPTPEFAAGTSAPSYSSDAFGACRRRFSRHFVIRAVGSFAPCESNSSAHFIQFSWLPFRRLKSA